MLKYPKITVCKQGMLRFMQYICCAAFIFPVKNYAIRCTFDRKKKEIQQIAFLFKMPKQSLQKNSPPDNHQFNLELWFEQKVLEMGTMAKNVVRLNAPAELYTVHPQIVSSLEQVNFERQKSSESF